MTRLLPMSLISLALLTACGGGQPTPLPPASGPVDFLSGTLVADPLPRYVAVEGERTDAEGNVTTVTLSRARAQASGFNLELPSGSSLKQSRIELAAQMLGCTGDLSASAPASGVALNELTGQFTTTDPTTGKEIVSKREGYVAVAGERPEFFLPKVNVQVYAALYASEDTTVTGEVSCADIIPGLSIPTDVKLELSAGWNVIGLSLYAEQTTDLKRQGAMRVSNPGRLTYTTLARFQASLPPF